MRCLRFAPVLCTILLYVVLLPCPCRADGLSVRIVTRHLARTFYVGEAIALTLVTDGPRQVVAFEVRDFDGARVCSGSTPMGAGRSCVIDPPDSLQTGLYSLRLTCPDGQTINDAFAVIPRPDATLDEPLTFSWHYGENDDAVYQLLAQVGCRMVRCDVDWPSTAREPGVLDLTKAQTKAALATRYGMRLIPILGYTPRYEGIRPANATGRAAIATHTWPPRTTENWLPYVRAVAGYFNRQTTTWPSTAVLSDGPKTAPATEPLIAGWEIWNEVDQNFYYGYWGRYLDLLRIAYCELHRQDPDARVIYGGSCGHWTELGMTYTMGGQYYFDALSLHPGGDFDDALVRWYAGAPQIGYGYGVYRETVFTESYLFPYPGLTYAESVLRNYSTLKAWGVREFCAYDGGRIVGATGRDSYAMASLRDGALVPNPAYVAQAVARWLLGDAAYVGSIALGSARAHVYVRGGVPMLVLWSDTAGRFTVSLDATASPVLVDFLGRRTRQQGASASVPVGPRPVAILGVGSGYVSQALRAWVALQLDTAAGFETDRRFGYIGRLRADLRSHGGESWLQEFESLVEWAGTRIAMGRGNIPAAFAALQLSAGSGMDRVLAWTGADPGRCQRANPTLHRLSKMVRAFGAVVDASGAGSGDPGRLAETVRTRLSEARAAERRRCPDGIAPRARVYLDLARQQLQQTNRRRGLGSLESGRILATVGRAMAEFDQVVTTRVFVVADFPTATQLVKGLALQPGAAHGVDLRLYNYSGLPVSATVGPLQLPEGWGAVVGSANLTAPDGWASPPVRLSLAIPGQPTPWVAAKLWTAAAELDALLPPTLNPNPRLWIGGYRSTGIPIASMAYQVGVGQLMGGW